MYITNTETQHNTKKTKGHVDEFIMAKMIWNNMTAADNNRVYGIRFFGLPPNDTNMFTMFMKTLVN